jgi:hypothetical protein
MGLFYSLRDRRRARGDTGIVYVRALTEPFGPAEAIKIETNKCAPSCAAKGEREISGRQRTTSERSLTSDDET